MSYKLSARITCDGTANFNRSVIQIDIQRTISFARISLAQSRIVIETCFNSRCCGYRISSRFTRWIT